MIYMKQSWAALSVLGLRDSASATERICRDQQSFAMSVPCGGAPAVQHVPWPSLRPHAGKRVSAAYFGMLVSGVIKACCIAGKW